MKKQSVLIVLFIFFTSFLYSQSTYSGNVSVSDKNFFSSYSRSSSDYYLGGCNAFPLGTYVNVKLPYSDDSANIKIVTRIPEDGIFIQISDRAGESLNLEIGDVLPVRIQVTKFTPSPLPELDSASALNPEPEIKGFTEEVLATSEPIVEEPIVEEPIVEEPILEEKVIEETPILEEPIVEEPILEEKVIEETPILEEPIVEEVILEEEVIEETPVLEEPIVEEEVILEEEVTEETPILEEPIVEEPIVEEPIVEEPIVEEPIVEEPIVEEPIVEEPITEIFSDDVEDSTFLNLSEPPKKIKRVFFLEPANRKPPIGGIPDNDLVPVIPVEESVILKDGYYLQVGIFIEHESVERDTLILEDLKLPYIVVKDENNNSRERVLVGPLSNDEMGVIMLYLENRGFQNFFKYKKKAE